MTVVAVDIRATAVKMTILPTGLTVQTRRSVPSQTRDEIGVYANLTPTVIVIVTVTMARLLHNVDQPRL